MDTKKLKLCRLCLKKLEDNFETAENIIEMMSVLLMQVNFVITKDAAICTTCFTTIKKLFFFKSMCLDVEESINQYIRTEKKLLVDLQEVYLNHNVKENQKYLQLDKKVCRFCLNPFETVAINEIKDGYLTDILQKYYPELDLSTTKGVSACDNCLDCLVQHFNFATNLLDTEKTVDVDTYCKMVANNNNTLIDLGSVLELSLENKEKVSEFVPKNNTSNGNELKGQEDCTEISKRIKSISPLNVDFDNIKCEELDIKTEFEESLSVSLEEKLPPDRATTPQTPIREKLRFRCNGRVVTTKKENSLNTHSIKQKYSAKTKRCRYRKKKRKVEMYKCDQCSFQTRYKTSAQRHTLVHREWAEVATFRCSQCEYRGKTRYALKMHKVCHRSKSELELHKCNQCSFEARLKGNLTKHMAKHNNPTYLCDICGFKTKYKLSLTTHLLIHKRAKFKCDKCSFTVTYKGNLKNHMLVHKSRSEVTMYKCGTCSFETKHKISLKAHTLRHKSSSELTLYKCNFCEFETKLKGNLKLHLLKHKDAGGTVMFKCDKCVFETKHKMSLKIHVLRHCSLSKVQMHKCDICDFQTLHKGNLKKHELKHKKASEVRIYTCDTCQFNTRHKESLKTHEAGHST